MPKAASATTKGTSSSKKTTVSKARGHTTAQSKDVVLVSPATPVESGAPSVEPPALPAAPESHALASILQRLDGLEEKITSGFAALAQELHTLQGSSDPAAVGTEGTSEAVLPLMTDVLRHNLIEHLSPVLAAMKRLEERIGFVANRLKFSGGGGGGSGGGQDRQKPWRAEQGRHPRPQRGQQNGQRPTPPQPQQWTPPSAASVQGHFAPRPLPGRGLVEEDD